MKTIYQVFLTLLIIASIGCNKSKNTPTISNYKIVVSQDSADELSIEYDGNHFKQTTLERNYDFSLSSDESKTIDVFHTIQQDKAITVSVWKDNGLSQKYIYYNHCNLRIAKGVSSATGGSKITTGVGGSGGSNSSSSTCPCGATTKDGTPCKRMVKGCTRCWQHS